MALRGAMEVAEVRHAAGSSHWYPHEVTDVCLQACLGQHTVNLSPVMRLVVEEVHQEHRFRLGHIAFGRTRVPSEVALDPSGVEPVCPLYDGGVERRPITLEVLPVLVK